MPVGAGAIRAGRAFVEVLADNSNLERGLRQAQRKLQGFGAMVTNLGRQFAILGVAVAAPLIGSTFAFAKAGDELDKMSKRTGVSVESLSALGFAAEQSGSSLDSVERGIRGMQRQLLQAERGSSAVTDALEKLGLTADDLVGKSTEEQFLLFAERLSRIGNESEMAGVAMQIFGRAGAELVPLLREGSGGIEALTARARELGITMSGEQADAAAKFTDAYNEVVRQIKQVVVEIGGSLAPMLTELRDYVTPVVRGVIDWVKANPELIRTILVAAAAVTGLGVALIVVGQVLIGLGAVVGAVATAWGLLTAAIGAMFTPVGLVVAAIAAATVAFFKFTDAGEATADRLAEVFGGAFRGIAGDLGTAFDGLKAALLGGDFEAAGEIAMAALQVVMLRGVNALKSLWRDLKDFVVETFASMQKEARKFWDNFVANTDEALGDLSPFAASAGEAGAVATAQAAFEAVGVVGESVATGRILDPTDAQRRRAREEARDQGDVDVLSARLEQLVDGAVTARADQAGVDAFVQQVRDAVGQGTGAAGLEGLGGAARESARQLNAGANEAVTLSSDAGLSALADVFRNDQPSSVEERQLTALKNIERNTDRRIAPADLPGRRG